MQSDRIGFRRWQQDDLPAAINLWGDPQVTRLFYKNPLTQEQVDRRLQEEIECEEKHHIQYWPIFLLENDSHIGCAGLRPRDEGILELGIHLKPEYWGRGFATEAGRRVIEHAFGNQLARAVFAGHHPDNKGSRNGLLKLGFLGTTAKLYEPTGLIHPGYLLYRENPSFATRPAVADDARALAIVHCLSIKDTFGGVLEEYVAERSLDRCEQAWERRFANNECTTLALLRGEQIAGFASIAPSPDEDVKGSAGELDRIYIHPSACGEGQGNALMHWCEETLKGQGFTTIKLWVFEVNDRARHFYEKHGYTFDGCSKQAFNTTLLRYTKTIERTGN
jgi:RimJ/RimL family protein N-acetyltransferase